MLFHEASHGVFDHVREHIDASLMAKGERLAIFGTRFYTAGEIVRQTLHTRGVEYVPVLYAGGVFARAWPQFQKPIETE